MEVSCPYCDTHLDSVDTLHQAYNRAPMYSHNCIRPCPICLHKQAQTIYQWSNQKILSCEDCGFIYADSPKVNYQEDSLYTDPSYYGSRLEDIQHYRMIVDHIHLYLNLNSRILDIGCATGGLLTELRRCGFKNIEGFDLSLKASQVCRDKGFIATSSFPTEKGKYDCIILSHVLEHVLDLYSLLYNVRRVLAPKGILYIEVPDATRYNQMQSITEGFNLEHINHFTTNSMYELLLRTGFTTRRYGDASFPHAGKDYPAFWTISCKRYHDHHHMNSYIKKLELDVERIKYQIPSGNFAIWGVGQLAHRIMDGEKVVAATDSNTAYHGKEMFGVKVVPPEEFNPDPSIPILICSQLHKDEIRQRIQQLGLKNKCIEIS